MGVMDNNGMIDPVVVSSCIFMEDETSETKVQCVIDKVCYHDVYNYFLHTC